ncbi:serine hydrolase domain-containing protein [Desulfobacter sp.]|uniref:serine hydrolase domain-containing protein n=1 Tax=Desulfobacter sp. TaxID=2294 RepID=UPI000E86848D|nr:serine hydrolase domain-containing protein [Desulfobacter sp.]MBP8829563.1 beta-lactamase family protein [Desulfobacter sp.]MBP9597820.1 beta-lactamase family protein [Desulfobacter sp.]HBT87067.1 serine hydrolase [Desulfobacter sp.]
MNLRAFQSIDGAMANAMADGVFPGAVLLWAHRNHIIYHKAFGVTDIRFGEPVALDTVFDLASLTKPLATALAVADLISSGRLSLKTYLKDALPVACGTGKAKITIDMLLRHRSGLPAHRPYFKSLSLPVPGMAAGKRLRQMVLAEPLEYEPGSKEVYSDLGFILLAWVVEYMSGVRLDAFVNDRIFAPLKIYDLFFNPLCADWTRPVMNKASFVFAATSHCTWRGKMIVGEVEDENAWAAGGVEGHAGLFGTAVGVHHLCCEVLQALENKESKVINASVIRSFVDKNNGMMRPAGFDSPSEDTPSSGRFFSKRSIGHLGFTGTSFWIDPDNGLITVLLTNRVHPSRENIDIRKFRPRIHDLIASIYQCNIQE